jgi:hypothetical protein
MLIMLTKLITTGLIGPLYLQGQLLSKPFLLKLQDVSCNNLNTIFTFDFTSIVRRITDMSSTRHTAAAKVIPGNF